MKGLRRGLNMVILTLLLGTAGAAASVRDMEREDLASLGTEEPALLTEDDLAALPPAVQKYIRLSGALGRAKVLSYSAEMKGRMHSVPGDAGMRVRCRQVNVQPVPARYFGIRAWRMGIPAGGRHVYRAADAWMKIRVLGLFPVVDLDGEVMDRGETVTLFNDMCMLAPATLIDPRISWLQQSASEVEAAFTVGHIRITARLFFNETGELVNFRSDDRAMRMPDNSLRSAPFSTPVLAYGSENGRRLPMRAQTVYHLPEGDFAYGDFMITAREENVHLKK